MDVVRGKTWDSKQVKLTEAQLTAVKMDIKTKKVLACKDAKIALGQMKDAKCLQKFVNLLYKGGKGKSGGTVFRGRAPRVSRMSRRNSDEYLARVKAVLTSTGVAKAAPAAPATPVTPAPPAGPTAPVAPVAPVAPAAAKPETDTKLQEAMQGAAYDVIVNDHCGSASASASTAVGGGKACKDMGGDEPVAVYKALKTIKLSEMKPELKTKIVAKFKKAIAEDAALKAKYGSKDADALAAKMWKPAGFGTEEPAAVTPTKPKKETKPEKKEKDDGKLGRLILMGAVGLGVGSLKVETSMPEPGTKPNQSEIWQINFDAGAKYRIAKNVYLGGQVGGWYNKFKRFDTDPGIGSTSAGGSIWGIHVGPAVAYMPHRKVMIDAAFMIGGHQATDMNMGVLGKGIKVKNAHIAFELGVKYLFNRYVWAGVSMQAIVGLGEAFGQEIKSTMFPNATGFSKLSGIQGMVKLGVSFDLLK